MELSDARKFKLSIQLFLLKTYLVLIWLIEIIHWNIIINGHSTILYEGFALYREFTDCDRWYFLFRIFDDFFTCFIGLGGAMWTFDQRCAIPCVVSQTSLIVLRLAMWGKRSLYNEILTVATDRDKIVLASEFILPLFWIILGLMIMNASRRLRDNEKESRPGSRPMVTVLDENGESEMALGSQLYIALEKLIE